jgi:hypothetical protein|tara:strand:+ start:498 stop:677 length:180 start_codon:yes stop_codon:yes gene_type:complete
VTGELPLEALVLEEVHMEKHITFLLALMILKLLSIQAFIAKTTKLLKPHGMSTGIMLEK